MSPPCPRRSVVCRGREGRRPRLVRRRSCSCNARQRQRQRRLAMADDRERVQGCCRVQSDSWKRRRAEGRRRGKLGVEPGPVLEWAGFGLLDMARAPVSLPLDLFLCFRGREPAVRRVRGGTPACSRLLSSKRCTAAGVWQRLVPSFTELTATRPRLPLSATPVGAEIQAWFLLLAFPVRHRRPPLWGRDQSAWSSLRRAQER